MVAEFLGTAFLLAIIVGSGIMGEKLAGGNEAIVLLANSMATGAGIFVIIQCLEPISGAHLNPLVSLTALRRGKLKRREALQYVAAQFLGAIVGVLAANRMFSLKILEISQKHRDGWNLALSEFIATFGLLAVIATVGRKKPDWLPITVGAYIASAYWFTSSTSFANPAVTVARAFTDTFCGIAPWNIIPFVAAQFVAGAVAYLVFD